MIGRLTNPEFVCLNDTELESYYSFLKKNSFRGHFVFQDLLAEIPKGVLFHKKLIEELIFRGLVIHEDGEFECHHIVGRDGDAPEETFDVQCFEEWIKCNFFVEDSRSICFFEKCTQCGEPVKEIVNGIYEKYAFRAIERKAS